ncbi:hypothetical protein Tco_1392505 [Tanacetum coccineum]
MFRETLADGALGPERDRVVKDLTPEEKERYKDYICATNILLQGLTKHIYTLINHYTDAKDIWDNVKMLLEGSEFTKLINDMRNIKMTMPKMQLNSKFMNNMLPEWGRFMTAVKLNRGLKTSNYDQLYAYLKQHEAHANENIMMLERYTQHAIDPLAFESKVSLQQYPTQSPAIPQSTYVPPVTYPPHFADNTHLDSRLTPTNDFIETLTKTGRQNRVQGNNARGVVAAGNRGVQNRVGNANPATDTIFGTQYGPGLQADQCDTFDSDVDEAPNAQTMFMANLSSADPIYDEAGPSYDSNILSEVQDHDKYIDSVGEYHEVHEMQKDVQQNYVVDSDAGYTIDSNIIPYEQYVKNNAEQAVQSNVSSVPNDALMMIINDMHEHAANCISANEQNKVVNESLTTELVRYKEQVEIYEKRTRFELTEREQKIDEQLRIVVTDRNIKEESLKNELDSVKMQLNSTIDHNKLMIDEVATLKKDFKQKENKYLEDFLDMKALKEKVEDKLFKQD